MKKTITLIILALMFAAGPLMSQKQFYFGIAGTGYTPVIMNQNNYGLFEMDYKTRLGIGANLNVGFDFSKHIGLKLEAGFAKLGQKYEDTRSENDTAAKYARDIKLNYLQIPILFKYRSNGQTARFYVMAGPQFNLLMSGKQDYTRNDTDFDWTLENKTGKTFNAGAEEIKERFSSLDIMGRVDLGVDITLVNNLFLNVGLTMAYGLLDINGTDWRMEDSTGKYNSSHNIYGGLNVGISYCIPVGK